MSYSEFENRREERLKAMRGDVSFQLDLDVTSHRAAVIYGIRHSLKLAQSDRISSLCSGDASVKNSDLCRARNARLIMSGIIPSMEELGSFEVEEERMSPAGTASVSTATCDTTLKRPYCIWHPESASEDFYRALVAKHPSLRYQVARACAAASYSTLYHDLTREQDILPDVSIAEEARESNTDGGKAIYDTIMSAPARYQIMNDYTRSIALGASYANAVPAFLNGDTIVRRLIDEQANDLSTPCNGWFNLLEDLPGRAFITEDRGIILDDPVRRRPYHLNDAEIALLYSPLPRDLPTMNKTLLVDMAAYNGDVDRYARLVNRYTICSRVEISEIHRGIHWNPLFARFWAQQLNDETDLAARVPGSSDRDLIRKAITARRVMCNDWSVFENG